MRNVTDLEAALRKKTDEIKAAIAANGERAEAENRVTSDEERAAVERLMGEARDLKAQIDRKRNDQAMNDEIARLTAGLSTSTPVDPSRARGNGTGAPQVRGSLGDQFVASSAFEFFRNGGHRTSNAWRSPQAELFDPRLHGATLTSDGASGGDLIQPDMRPGILPLLFNELRVADLLASGTTESNLVSYMRELAFTNAADTVAEGAPKPESALTFEATSDPVRKIAHWLPVTEEMLEDAAQVRSYIDARLRLGVQLAEDDQLLQGSGVAPDILGIRNRPGLSADVPRGTDNNADAIFKQIVAVAAASLIQPDGVVLNGANWSPIELMKDTGGGYLAGGPFSPRITRTLWGVRVVLTPAMAAGVGLVGAFATGAQFFRKGGIRVEASNSHADFFVKNLVAIRAEERGALAVYRPAAFGEVTGLE